MEIRKAKNLCSNFLSYAQFYATEVISFVKMQLFQLCILDLILWSIETKVGNFS